MLFATEADGTLHSIAWGLVTVPFLIAITALFIAAQFSLVALRRTRVEELERQGVAGARSVGKAMDSLDHCVAATQVGTVLAGLLLGWIGEPAMAGLLERLFDHGNSVAFRSVTAIGTFAIITFLSVVFGELIPKTVGLQSSERTALWIARPLLMFTWLSGPVVRFMDGTGNLILRLFGYAPDPDQEQPHSVDELTLLIEDSAEAGVLMANQAAFTKNLLHLWKKKVAEAMIPIDKVGLIEYGGEPEVILKRIAEGTFTRMPAYQGSKDNILGIINTKQLLRRFTATGSVALEESLYPAIFLTGTETLPEAMVTLRQARFPMGVVRDAEGKVLGILTLEDILTEVVGEIVDEHDYPAPKVTPRMLQALLRSLPKRKPGEKASETVMVQKSIRKSMLIEKPPKAD